MNSLPKTVTRQRHGCDLNLGPSAPESSTLTTRLPSHSRGLAWGQIYYLTTFLRLSYDNAKVKMDLRRMSNLQKKTFYEGRKAFLR